jgi:hypothetical protein
MRKFTIIGIVIVLLAFSAIPVFGAGPNNGHGNGNGVGQSNTTGDKNQTRQQDKDQTQNRDQVRLSNPGRSALRNQAGNRMRQPFYLQGTIKSINSTNHTLTITVFHANARAKQFIGTDLVVTVSTTARIFEVHQGNDSEGSASSTPSFSTAPSASSNDEGPGERVAITFSKLAAKDIVAIHGNLVGEVYNATLITVYTKLAGIQP